MQDCMVTRMAQRRHGKQKPGRKKDCAPINNPSMIRIRSGTFKARVLHSEIKARQIVDGILRELLTITVSCGL